MRKLVVISILMVVAILPMGCRKRPKGVLSEKEMIGLIADMEVAQGYFMATDEGEYTQRDRDGAAQYVLDKHHLTKAEFDSTMTWYGRNVDEYRKLCEKVDKELTKRQKRIPGEKLESEVIEDMWPYSRHFAYNNRMGSDNLIFSIPAKDILPGDRINWKLRMLNPPDGNVMIGVEYDNGTSSYSYQSLYSQNKVDLTLQTDTAKRVKRVFGKLRLKPAGVETVWIDSIALGRLPYDSTLYYRVFSQRKVGVPARPKPIMQIDSLDREDKIVAEIEADQR